MQDKLQRWGHEAERACELKPGQRNGHWHLVICIRFSTHTKNISLNHIYPALPRKEAPNKLVSPIWLCKAPQKPWLQQPQATMSTFVLSCLCVAKTAAQREFDSLSLLLKSHSAIFATENLFFFFPCPIALVADNIKLSENKRCQRSLRTQSWLLQETLQ